MTEDDTTGENGQGTPVPGDNTVEIDALKDEITSLKAAHKTELDKLTEENRRLKDKLVVYLTTPADKMPEDDSRGKGLGAVGDWIQGSE